MTGKTLSHYTVLENIGAGGMGVVYRAWDSRLERDVALKVLPAGTLADEGARRKFRKEALALSKLNHANIATIHDFDSEQGVDFLVMEYIPGQTLASRLNNGPLAEQEIVELASQIAAGLQDAHESAFIHRDLKPGNVMVTPKKQVKILDFGLAQLFRHEADATTTITDATESRGIPGTLPYMSPEQLRGETLDPRTDIYSFGVMLYEMATGTRPFRTPHQALLIDAILNKTPDPPTTLNARISPYLESIILKCLEKHLQNRYQTVKEIGADLRRLTAGTAPAPSSVRTGGGRPLIIDSLVVVPTKVFGGEADAFLTDAIPSFLSTRLAQVPDLDTKIPPSSLDMERLKGDIGKVAEAYEVNALILSMVTVHGRKLTLNIQMVEAKTRRLIWSQEFAGTRTKYQQLVRSASEGIRQAIRPSAEGPASTRSQHNVEAELTYQRGLYQANLYLNRGRKEDLDLALETFERVLQLDPSRAEAAAQIARLHSSRFGSAAMAEFRPLAQHWALRALELDPKCARAWSVLAAIETAEYRRKLEYALKGASLGERDAFVHAHLGHALARSSYALSLEASRQASRLDPLMAGAAITEAIIASALGRAVDAVARVESALRIEPDSPLGLMGKCQVLVLNHQVREAEMMLPRLEALAAEKRLQPEWVDYLRQMVVLQKATEDGQTADADEAAEGLEKKACGELQFPRWQILTQGVAGMLAAGGRVEAAIRTVETRNRIGLVDPYDYLLFSPDYLALRRDRRFVQLASAARAGFEEMVGILREAEARKEVPGYLAAPMAEVLERVRGAAAGAR